MPKRSNSDKIESLRKKIRKLQEKEQAEEQRRRRRVIPFSDSDESSENERNGDEDVIPADNVPPGDPLSEDAPAISDHPMEAAADQTVDVTPAPVVDDVSDPTSAVPELDPDVLSALGESIEEVPKFGEKIHQKLAQLWIPILRKGLNKEAKEKLTKQFLIPENCVLLQAPKLNPEIAAACADITKYKDKRIEAVQQQLGCGITALNRGLSLLLEPDTDKVEAIKHLSDSCRLLCDLHFVETEARKKLVTPGLDKTFLNLIQDVDRDETLFGSKLSEKIKASKVIEKQSLQIKKALPITKPAASTSYTQSTNSRPRPQGNWTGPSRYPYNKGGRGGPKKPAQAQPSRRSTQAYQPRPSTSTKQPRAPSQRQ